MARNAFFAALSLTLSAVLFTGCPTGDDGTGEPLISVFPVGGGSTQIPADGNTRLRFQVRAQDAAGEADNRALTISVNTGQVNDLDEVEVGATITLTPDDGETVFEYTCAVFEAGTQVITVTNGDVTSRQNVTCVAPQATVSLRAPNTQCNQLTAALGNNCAIPVTVEVLIPNSTPLPQPGASVTASVTEVTDAFLNGVEDEGNDAVLALTPSGVAASSVSATTADDGSVPIYVIAPQTLLEQRMTIEFTTSVQGNLASVTTTVTIKPFADNVFFSVTPAQNSVEGGTELAITVIARNDAEGADSSGLLGKAATLVASDQGGNLDGPPYFAVAGEDETSVVLDTDLGDDGVMGTTTITLPNLVPGADQSQVSVLGTFVPDDALEDFTKDATAVINVLVPGALLLNASLNKNTIYSDQGETATLTVTLNQSGSPVDRPVDVTIDPSAQDRANLRYPGQPVGDSLSQIPTGDDGNVQITVEAEDTLAKGPVTIQVSVLDDSVNPPQTKTAEVNLLVDRVPVLQNVVYNGANPAVLGVAGGALPSSSQACFQAYYDDGSPVPTAAVVFSLPASADPTATVTPVGTNTDASGVACTTVSAGSQASPLSVTATVTKDGVTVSSGGFPIPVVGGLPNFSQSYLTCAKEGVIHEGGAVVSCTATVADRFSNQIQQDLAVQFRTEAGNITPYANLGDSAATATYVSGQPGAAYADVRDWSYGIVLPFTAGDFVTNVGDNFVPADCFDGSTATACNHYYMCADGSNDPYCTLPLKDDGSGCWESIPQLGLEMMGVDTADCDSNIVGADRVITCNDGSSVTIPNDNLNGLLYATDPNVSAAVDDLRNHMLDCGYPVTCLVGRKDGFSFVTGDECPVALGCFDFDGTYCPHQGLVSVMASVRGEEGFVDLNGNGLFDYTDTNNNNLHDPGEPAAEPWVDMPEPFLDKGDNCVYDDYAFHPRLEPYEEIQHSDLYSDVDQSGDFGFVPVGGPADARVFANQRWDRDTEIFFQARMVKLLGGPFIDYGELCTPAEVVTGHTCSDGTTAACKQVNEYYGVALGCTPTALVSPELINDPDSAADFAGSLSSYNFAYDWRDANGNCYSPGFAATTGASAEGALKLTGTGVAKTINECGITDTGNGTRNPRRPYCEDYPLLGTPMYDLSATIDCDNSEGLDLSTVTISHSSGTDITVGLVTICPACGDGYVTGDEVCDPADPVTGGNCTPDCELAN